MPKGRKPSFSDPVIRNIQLERSMADAIREIAKHDRRTQAMVIRIMLEQGIERRALVLGRKPQVRKDAAASDVVASSDPPPA
jgi:hypothetical protein